MLQQICEHLHNYFIKESLSGDFEIAANMISLPLLDGQRFLITGSVLNDGVYTYHEAGIGNDDDTEVVGLRDESFSGTICGLAIPPAMIALSGEIKLWVEQNSAKLANPYKSESWQGYTYTKDSGKDGRTLTWGDVFKSRLDPWRKLCL